MNVTRKIIHYDLASLTYSSFFITGFRANAKRLGYRFEFAKDIPSELIGAPAKESLRALKYILFFRAELDSEPFYFCIDTRDSANVVRGSEEPRRPLPLLDVVKYYFKVNLNRQLIDSDPLLVEHRNKIMPAAPFFPVMAPAMRFHIPRLRPYPAALWGSADLRARFKESVRIKSLPHVLRLRGSKKTHDVFFVSRYYPEPLHAQHMQFRAEVMREIRRQRGISGVCGFNGDLTRLPSEWADLAVEKFSYDRYLGLLSAARTGVYVRGLLDCASFKFAELLALGLPIVGESLANDVDVVVQNERLREQLRYDTPRQIAERLARILAQDAEREGLAAENARLFDKHLTPSAATGEILGILGFGD